MRTPEDLGRYFRADVMEKVEVQYGSLLRVAGVA
jgi:hypothetical protein